MTANWLDEIPTANANPAPGPVGVAVVEAAPDVLSRLASRVGQVATFASIEAFETAVAAGEATVLVAGPSCGGPDGLTNLQRLIVSRPEVGVVMVVEELTTEFLQRALRAGVRDMLTTSSEEEQLVESVGRVASSLAMLQRPSEPSQDASESHEKARLMTVFSTKGGAGKSVLAANLAVILARRSERPVVLVDADLQFGDVAVMLKLAPQHTIVDAVNSINRLDVQLLQSLLVRHEPSGLLVLPAPLEPAFADQVGASEMNKIVAVLRTFCEYVVVDTPAYFNDVVLSLLEESDDILLVAGMDIPNIKNVKIGLQTLRLLNTPMSKLKLILNRANSKVKLDVSEVERTLQLKADSLVPSDVVVPQSVNKGTPVVLDAPKSGVAKAIEELADLLTINDGAQRRRS